MKKMISVTFVLITFQIFKDSIVRMGLGITALFPKNGYLDILKIKIKDGDVRLKYGDVKYDNNCYNSGPQ